MKTKSSTHRLVVFVWEKKDNLTFDFASTLLPQHCAKKRETAFSVQLDSLQILLPQVFHFMTFRLFFSPLRFCCFCTFRKWLSHACRNSRIPGQQTDSGTPSTRGVDNRRWPWKYSIWFSKRINYLLCILVN